MPVSGGYKWEQCPCICWTRTLNPTTPTITTSQMSCMVVIWICGFTRRWCWGLEGCELYKLWVTNLPFIISTKVTQPFWFWNVFASSCKKRGWAWLKPNRWRKLPKCLRLIPLYQRDLTCFPLIKQCIMSAIMPIALACREKNFWV